MFLLMLPARAFPADPFPRLGGYLIGNPKDYWDAASQRQIARLDIAVLNPYPGWGVDHGTSIEQAVRSIKAINPKTRIFLYVIAESRAFPSPSAWADLQAKLDGEGWWLYKRGAGPEKVLSDFGNETYILNITRFAPRDAGSRTFAEWFADYIATRYVPQGSLVDGLYVDNVFWSPRRDGDWNRDGVTDSHTNPLVRTWFRQGYRTLLDALAARTPGKYLVGNVADWGHVEASFPEYQGLLNGGVLEAMIGQPYSVETWAGWRAMLAWYRKTTAAMAQPKLAIFNQIGDPSDYQGFRYGFASCLMDDAYYSFTDRAAGYHGVPWFDEYEVALGQPVSAPPVAAWSAGVFRRDFEGGIALVNPKGNGARDVVLETAFATLKGSQDPSVNSGQNVRRVHLKDRDGIILLRSAAPIPPSPPRDIRIDSQ